jgi:hypothetical protein
MLTGNRMTQMLTWSYSKTERSGNRMTQMLTWTYSKTERSGLNRNIHSLHFGNASLGSHCCQLCKS